MHIGSLSSLFFQGRSAALAQSNAASPVAAATEDSESEFGGSVGTASAATAPVSSNSLSGDARAAISDSVLALLTQLKQMTDEQSAAQGLTPPSSTTIQAAGTMAGSSGPTGGDPLSQLIAAMDSSGNGSVSQGEMQSYIQSLGGTAKEADALFSGLGGSGDLTQTQLASDLQQASALQQPDVHHHHHFAMPSADQVGNDFVKVIDSDGNGSADSSEFQKFVTGLGGTTAQANTVFTALDTTGSGSVNAAQFSTAVQAFESAANAAANAAGSNGASAILTLLDGFGQNPAGGITA